MPLRMGWPWSQLPRKHDTVRSSSGAVRGNGLQVWVRKIIHARWEEKERKRHMGEERTRSRGRFWAWWHPPLHPRRGIYASQTSLRLYKRLFLRLALVWGPDTPILRVRGRRGFRLFGPFIFSRSGLQGYPNDGLTTMADPAYCFSLDTIKLKPGAIDRLCPRVLTRRRL